MSSDATRLRVVDPGILTTVQDLGRPGRAHLGVPRAGAADLVSHRWANTLVGNPAAAATLEIVMVGCTLQVESSPGTSAVIAVAGARCDLFVGGVRTRSGVPVRVAAGQVVRVGPAQDGARSYLAVRGGIAVPEVLGSRSTDTLSGLGPPPVTAGDELPIGGAEDASPELFAAGSGECGTPVPLAGEIAVLATMRGPRADWLDGEGWGSFLSQIWTTSPSSNRVGVRLDGVPLPRVRAGEIASEGMVLGAVQLPPNGLPVIFLADHPTTGGYPVVGVLTPGAVARAAQLGPGSRVRFAEEPTL